MTAVIVHDLTAPGTAEAALASLRHPAGQPMPKPAPVMHSIMTDAQVAMMKARDVLNEPKWTIETLRAGRQRDLEACIDAIGPATASYQDVLAHAETEAKNRQTLTGLDQRVAERRANVERLMADGNIDEAVNEQKALDATQSIRDRLAPLYEAERAYMASHKLDEAERTLALLVSKREDLTALLASPARLQALLDEQKEQRRAAAQLILDDNHAHMMIDLQIASANDPAKIAAAHQEEERRKTAERHAEREAAGRKAAPPKHSNNAGAVALERMRNRQPVGNPLYTGGVVR